MKKAGDLLSSFFDRETYSVAREYALLFNSWRTISGDTFASHSRIRELDKTILIIEADHPGWIQLLQAKQVQLLEGVRRNFPELNITGIAIRLARDTETRRQEMIHHPESPKKEHPESAIKESISAPGAEISDLFGKIQNEGFKETLKRLERSIASRNSLRNGDTSAR